MYLFECERDSVFLLSDFLLSGNSGHKFCLLFDELTVFRYQLPFPVIVRPKA